MDRSVMESRIYSVLLALFLFITLSSTSRVSAETLVGFGSPWAFHRGSSAPSLPDQTAWRNRDFDDAGWETGLTGIGYGDNDDATVLSAMKDNYLSVYMRRRFHVADVSEISSLLLRVDYDDGFVAYINGREVARAGAGNPGQELNYDDKATLDHEAGVVESFDATSGLLDLVDGENVLAIEVHNLTVDSSDLSLNARLAANEGPPEEFFDFGSTWKFFRGASAPSVPATAWRTPEFVDTSWESGPTGIGYGDGDDATVLSDMEGNYSTVYLRRTFQVSDINTIATFFLQVDFDDGFVCYINGVEAARAFAGSPGRELSFQDTATGDHEVSGAAYLDLASVIDDLVVGQNLIAVEVHNLAVDSSDLSFNSRLAANEPPPTFLSVGFFGLGGRASWADFNNDGFVDLFTGTLWLNEGGKSFTSLGTFSGAGVWGDFDNDGYVDLFSFRAKKLFRNEDGQTLRDVTAAMIPELPTSETLGAVWGDFNGDSFVDLYIGGYEIWEVANHPDAILMNEGGQSFRLAWVQSGDIDPARGITAADFDQDADLDVYVSNYRLEQNQLWVNEGDGFFENLAPSLGVEGIYDGTSFSYGHTIGSAWGDLDDDGLIDLFVGNFSHPDASQDRPRFYRNLGPSSNYEFEDRSADAGLAWQESFASPALGDMDNDGDLDLFFTTVYVGDQSVLLENRGDFVFQDVTDTIGDGVGRGPTYQVSWADYNNDGQLDLMTHGQLYRNHGNESHWLKVRLHGDGFVVNRSAIGAQVRAELPGRTITRHVASGTGQGNSNDLTLHFGFAGFDEMVPLEIFWPDGTLDSMTVAPDQTVEFTYGEGACSVRRSLPETYAAVLRAPVSVSLLVRGISGATTVSDTVPAGWTITSSGEGQVVGNTIEFAVLEDDELSYEVLPDAECTGSFSGGFLGPDDCVGDVRGASTITCTGLILLDKGDEVSYFLGSTPAPASWNEIGFSDEGWSRGKLGIGYGDGDDQTILGDMSTNYASVYVRAPVDLTEHGLSESRVESLELRVRFDDGLVAYLNGTEFARPNMPTGAITNTSLTDGIPVDDAPLTCETNDHALGCAIVPVPVHLLAEGANVFAFSVHNQTLASSDLSFIPTIEAFVASGPGVPEALFRRGDCDQSGTVDFNDAIFHLRFLFLGENEDTVNGCKDACDSNDSGADDFTDDINTLKVLFLGQGVIPEPGPLLDETHPCGLDPTLEEPDELTCETYAPTITCP